MVFSRFQHQLWSQTFVCVLPPSFATCLHLKVWKPIKRYSHDFTSFQYFAKCLVFASSSHQPRGEALSYKAFWPTLKMAVQSVVFSMVSPVWLPLASQTPKTNNDPDKATIKTWKAMGTNLQPTGFYIPTASKNHPPRNKQYFTISLLTPRLYLCKSLLFLSRIMVVMWFDNFGKTQKIMTNIIICSGWCVLHFPASWLWCVLATLANSKKPGKQVIGGSVATISQGLGWSRSRNP